jgi:hypothetical protein
MTDLTYTIIHVQVGAEKYWEEVEGFVRNDKTSLFLYEGGKPDYFFKNDNLPLSDIAKRLGAKVYGGFEDEKDFYLVIPRFRALKVGDVLRWVKASIYYLIMKDELGFFKNTESDRITSNWCKYIACMELKGNIFQEYARTGIIESELYKQFSDCSLLRLTL